MVKCCYPLSPALSSISTSTRARRPSNSPKGCPPNNLPESKCLLCWTDLQVTKYRLHGVAAILPVVGSQMNVFRVAIQRQFRVVYTAQKLTVEINLDQIALDHATQRIASFRVKLR